MAELILHHYDLSPFSEKVRLAFGLKGLSWRSVVTPIWMPKPDLMPLTGGYRRAPVLQVGADVYCDTLLILREIERRKPSPTLYPGGQVGLASLLSDWFDTATFVPAASLATSVMGDQLPEEFLTERLSFMEHDFSKAASERDLPLNRARMNAAMAWLIDMMKDGRSYIFGDAVSAADLSAYHTIWFARQHGGSTVEAMLPLGPLETWMQRIAALGHGERIEMTGAEALEVARAATPEAPRLPGADPSGFEAGQMLEVKADDRGRDPVRGTLVAADAEELVIEREDAQVGRVHLHFPRVGFDVLAAQ